MFAPYDEEFEALPDDAEEDGFAAAPSVRAGSGAVGGGALVPIGEQEDDFYEPPPPDEEEFAPMPDEQAEVEALEDGKVSRPVLSLLASSCSLVLTPLFAAQAQACGQAPEEGHPARLHAQGGRRHPYAPALLFQHRIQP